MAKKQIFDIFDDSYLVPHFTLFDQKNFGALWGKNFFDPSKPEICMEMPKLEFFSGSEGKKL